MKILLCASIIFAATCAQAQGAGFPDDATVPSADAIQQHLNGNAFDIKLADGSSWHVQYGKSGDYEFKSSKGFADHGDWKAEDGKICSKGTKIPYSCSDVKMKGDLMYLKRDNGEVVQFVQQQ